MRCGCFHFRNNLSFVDTDWLVINGVDNLEFEVFWIVLVCHKASDDALEKFFVDATGDYMVDDCFYVLHKVVGVPIIIAMNEESDTDSQCHLLIGILETDIEHGTEVE